MLDSLVVEGIRRSLVQPALVYPKVNAGGRSASSRGNSCPQKKWRYRREDGNGV